MDWTDILKGFGQAAQIGGAVYQASTAYSQARLSETRADAQRAANEAAAVLAENNAKLSDWLRQDAIARGQDVEAEVRLNAAAVKGAQIARFAAGNIALDEGSALRVITDTDVMAEIDANTARANTAKEGWVYENRAIDQRNRAALARAGYVQPATDATSAVVGSVLSSSSQIAPSWYRASQR